MGKKQEIKSLVNSIALVSLHKILLEYTNKPESIKHLEDEKRDYSEGAYKKSIMYTWTKGELIIIEEKLIRETRNRLLNRYSDIDLDDSKLNEFVVDSMKELFLK